VVIADDHPLMRAALREAVSARIDGLTVLEVSSIGELLSCMDGGLQIDAVMLDLRMPDSKGFSALVQVRTRFPEVPVIVVSAVDDDDAIHRALLLGASGYIVKSAPVEMVGAALADVLAGNVVRPPGRNLEFEDEETSGQFRRLRSLTPQQFNVLVMIAEGYSNKMIAQQMDIMESTVKSHITSILLKLQLQRRTQAAVLAQRALQLDSVLAREDLQLHVSTPEQGSEFDELEPRPASTNLEAPSGPGKPATRSRS
jgi:DNA-binding NarL/FixJ family response regulator